MIATTLKLPALAMRLVAILFSVFLAPCSCWGQTSWEQTSIPNPEQPGFREQLPDFGDRIVYSPGFREVFGSYDNSARNVELNRRTILWQKNQDNRATPKATTGAYSARVSTLGDRPPTSSNSDDLYALHDILSDDWDPGVPESSVEFFYGARLLDSHDRLFINMSGGNLGSAQIDTRSSSSMFGPQAGLSSTLRMGNFAFNSRLSSMVAYHDREYSQFGFIGENLTPARFNSPLYIRPKAFEYNHDSDSIAHVGELRLSASYWLNERAKLNVTWSNTYLSSIYTTNSVNYVLFGGNSSVVGRAFEESSSDALIDSLQFSLVITR